MSRAYEYTHIVLFQETNLVGNVYFAHHIAWQGACREHFLRDHAPDILAELSTGLSLVTVSCGCDYLAELAPFDHIVIRMSLVEALQHRLDLRFDYVRRNTDDQLVAIGRQRIACMRRERGALVATQVPSTLAHALAKFT